MLMDFQSSVEADLSKIFNFGRFVWRILGGGSVILEADNKLLGPFPWRFLKRIYLCILYFRNWSPFRSV